MEQSATTTDQKREGKNDGTFDFAMKYDTSEELIWLELIWLPLQLQIQLRTQMNVPK